MTESSKDKLLEADLNLERFWTEGCLLGPPVPKPEQPSCSLGAVVLSGRVLIPRPRLWRF